MSAQPGPGRVLIETDAGKKAELITLSNVSGATVEVLTYGAIIRAIRVPDRDGVLGDVVLGYDSLQAYFDDRFFLGAVMGRFANRIAGARFQLDDRTYQLPKNDGANHLHGGPGGFHTRAWEVARDATDPAGSIRLVRSSPDGEEGYPGHLDVAVVYSWTESNELIVDYHATTDRPTPVNFTQHAYFNLHARCDRDILDHELRMEADHVLAVDDGSIPVALEPVAGTAFDFRTARPIATACDHCFVLRNRSGTLQSAALLHEPDSGRTLEVLTTEPALQLYTGQFLGRVTGKGDCMYGPHAGLCLETQHYPDSPNRSDFPSTILRPGSLFRSTTIFRFGVH